MAGARVASATVDFFHNDRGFSQPQARAAVLLRNQRGHPACLRERVDKLFGVAARLVDLTKVFVWKLLTQVSNGVANVLVLVIVGIHDFAYGFMIKGLDSADNVP